MDSRGFSNALESGGSLVSERDVSGPGRVITITSEIHVLLRSELKGIRRLFAITVIGSFVLTPLVGHGAAVIFGLAQPQMIRAAVGGGALPLFSLAFLLWISTHYWRFLQPVIASAETGAPGDGFAELARRRMARFSLDYWGFYLCYVLLLPQLYLWGGAQAAAPGLILQFTLLQLVVAILIGLMVIGILAGDFVETWRNGATL